MHHQSTNQDTDESVYSNSFDNYEYALNNNTDVVQQNNNNDNNPANESNPFNDVRVMVSIPNDIVNNSESINNRNIWHIPTDFEHQDQSIDTHMLE